MFVAVIFCFHSVFRHSNLDLSPHQQCYVYLCTCICTNVKRDKSPDMFVFKYLFPWTTCPCVRYHQQKFQNSLYQFLSVVSIVRCSLITVKHDVMQRCDKSFCSQDSARIHRNIPAPLFCNFTRRRNNCTRTNCADVFTFTSQIFS